MITLCYKSNNNQYYRCSMFKQSMAKEKCSTRKKDEVYTQKHTKTERESQQQISARYSYIYNEQENRKNFNCCQKKIKIVYATITANSKATLEKKMYSTTREERRKKKKQRGALSNDYQILSLVFSILLNIIYHIKTLFLEK